MAKQFKVIRILDEYRIIINAGSLHGVTENDLFEIHGVVDQVYDPDTNELLGTLDGIKAKVRPVDIHEKMCVCKNLTEYTTNLSLGANLGTASAAAITAAGSNLLGLSSFMPGIGTALGAALGAYWITKKLNVDKSQISNPELYEPIQLGDEAKLIKNSTPITKSIDKDCGKEESQAE